MRCEGYTERLSPLFGFVSFPDRSYSTAMCRSSVAFARVIVCAIAGEEEPVGRSVPTYRTQQQHGVRPSCGSRPGSVLGHNFISMIEAASLQVYTYCVLNSRSAAALAHTERIASKPTRIRELGCPECIRPNETRGKCRM